MLLDSSQLRAALYAVDEMVRQRRIAGRPIPEAVVVLHRVLVGASMSAVGPSPDTVPPALVPPDPISSQEAAVILDCTARHVRRLHADLEAQRIGGRWVMARQTVADYRDGRSAAR